MKSVNLLVALAVFVAVFATTAVAAPLPAGTLLSLEQGVGSALNTPCVTGSCFSMEVSPGQVIWTDFGAGTDGGIVVGKAQTSGGQELALSGTNATDGELSGAWLFFSNYGTFFTSPGGDTQNIFDDAPCAGAACIGKTTIAVFNVAWNGNTIPVGNGTVSDYQINPAAGGAWSMSYSSVVPPSAPGGFGLVNFSAIMRGTVTPGPCADAATRCNDGNVCTDDSCDPATGACINTPNTAACDDGNACTTGDRCFNGVCMPGTVKNCSDNNSCTMDSCNPSTGVCMHTNVADGTTCNDGNACTLNDQCVAGVCTGTPMVCNDNNPCTTDICLAGVCKYNNNTLPCNDNNPCTVNDVCFGGSCKGTAKNCSDNNICTTDSCDPSTGVCSSAPVICPNCGLSGTPLPAGTKLGLTQGTGSAMNTPCATGSCFGMEVTPGTVLWTDFGPGTDGGIIVGKSQASGGQELALSATNTTPGQLSNAWLFFNNYGTFITMPDGGTKNIYDSASCVGACCVYKTQLRVFTIAWNGGLFPMGSDAGCTLSGCTAAQREGVFVNNYQINNVTGGSWSMNYSSVVPNGQFANVKFSLIMRGVVTPIDCGCCDASVRCNDNNPCTDDSCDSATGICIHTNNTAPCNDGNACTLNDTCSGGVCVGIPINCNDNNACTDDSCVAGACVFTLKNCNDNNPCTTDTCDPATGVCTNTPITGCGTGTPLPNGTILGLDQGSGSAPNTPCATGSCFSMEVSPGFVLWTDFGPGTDGGIVVGKAQLSGGQEVGPSSTITTDGELSSAWSFFSAYGTFYTGPGGDTQNRFNNAPCSGAGCIGKTTLAVFNVAWNGNIIPLGSAVGCSLSNCSADQQAGIFVNNYQIDPVNGTWSMNYSQVVPSGSFMNVKFSAIMRGGGLIADPCADAVTRCNDNNSCTADSCNPTTGACVHTSIANCCNTAADCNDNNVCTADTCVNNVCVHTLINDGYCCSPCDPFAGRCDPIQGCPLAPCVVSPCDDNNVCTDDSCLNDVCIHTSNTAPCNDGNACTTGDVCSGGVCAGTPMNCNDGDACTVDSCSAGSCTHVLDCSLPGCSTDPRCVITPPATTTYTLSINSASSIVHTTGGLSGQGMGDLSISGTFQAVVTGGVIQFHNINVTTSPAVNPSNIIPGYSGTATQSGANFMFSGSEAYDNSTGGGTFSGSISGSGFSMSGNFNAPCCDQYNYQFVLNGTVLTGPCADAAIRCDDNNLCTTDGCDSATGVCTHFIVADGTACSDGNACTAGDTCQGGVCTPGISIVCTALDQCHVAGVCNTATGACNNPPAPNGTPCNDGNLCTTNDICSNGVCAGIPLVICTALDQCHLVGACDPATGVCSNPTKSNGTVCNDGNACTVGDVCANGLCAGTPMNCDDGNVCTDDSCVAGACVHINNTAACDDGNACTVGDFCFNGICFGLPMNCDDGNVCTEDSCNPASGCVHTNNTLACNDGNACTVNDVCSNGVCVPGAAKNCDDSNCCTTDSCDSATGACINTAIPSCGTAGNPLPVGTKLGIAQGDGAGAQCTTGSCFGMEVAPDFVVWTDFGPGTDGGFVVGKDQACGELSNLWSFFGADGSFGTAPGGGTLNLFDSASCSGLDCVNKTELKVLNVCWNGQTIPVGSSCGVSDYQVNPVSSAWSMNYGSVVPSGAFQGVKFSAIIRGTLNLCATMNCDDGNVCTDDSCVAGVCVHTPNTAACNDGNACTVGDVCSGGVCIPGSPMNCDDGNLCTADSCDPTTGCKHLEIQCLVGQCNPLTGKCDPSYCGAQSSGTPCDDGNGCTVNDTCSAGVCMGTPKNCNDGNVCTDDTCNPTTGACVHTNNTAPCDDGNCETIGDKCSNGVCVPGALANCDDGNVCTTDTYDCANHTCIHTNNTAACNDGNACTLNDVCSNGTCKGTPKNCDDGNVCTDDSCNPATGACVYTNNTAPCDDGNACTVGDTCSGGVCVPGPVKLCNDNNACTTDVCDPTIGACVYTPVPDGTACTLNSQPGACTAGQCIAYPACPAGSVKMVTIRGGGQKPASVDLQIQTQFSVVGGGCITGYTTSSVTVTGGTVLDCNFQAGKGPQPSAGTWQGNAIPVNVDLKVTCPATSGQVGILTLDNKLNGGKDNDKMTISVQ